MGQRAYNKLVVFDFAKTLDNGHGWYDGLVDEVESLHANGWKMAIISLSPEAEIGASLQSKMLSCGTPLTKIFDPIAGIKALTAINSGEPNKTTKAVMEHILAVTGIDKEHTVVVGDAFTEQILANNTSTKFLHAGWGDPTKEGLQMGVSSNLLSQEDVDNAHSIQRVSQLQASLEGAFK